MQVSPAAAAAAATLIQAHPARHLAVVDDPQALRVSNLGKVDVGRHVVVGRQAETVAEAGRASGRVDDGAGGSAGEGDAPEQTGVGGRGGVRVRGHGEGLEAEDVDLGRARVGHGGAGGEAGLELAAVAAGGDVVEAHQHVVVVGVTAAGDQGHVDGHVVGRGARILLVDVVDKGRVDGAAGARDQVGGAGWRGGGEEGCRQDGGGDGESVHFDGVGCFGLVFGGVV